MAYPIRELQADMKLTMAASTAVSVVVYTIVRSYAHIIIIISLSLMHLPLRLFECSVPGPLDSRSTELASVFQLECVY